MMLPQKKFTKCLLQIFLIEFLILNTLSSTITGCSHTFSEKYCIKHASCCFVDYEKGNSIDSIFNCMDFKNYLIHMDTYYYENISTSDSTMISTMSQSYNIDRQVCVSLYKNGVTVDQLISDQTLVTNIEKVNILKCIFGKINFNVGVELRWKVVACEASLNVVYVTGVALGFMYLVFD